MDTTAVKNGSEWVINGRKEFITSVPVGDTFGVLCQTDLTVTPSHGGESLLLMERDTPGLDATKLKDEMGIKSPVLFH